MGGPVADTRLLRLLSSLEVQFDAAVTREEDDAASDLALSLRQGLALRDVMRRGPWVARVHGARRPVVLVGSDFVACDGPDTILLPYRRLVVAPAETGDVPRGSPLSLLDALRRLCRSGVVAEICAGAEALRGRLIQVGPDHAAVEHRSGRSFVALDAVDYVRIAGRDETGAALRAF